MRLPTSTVLPVLCDVENVSDGYHTFAEPYAHRNTLWAVLLYVHSVIAIEFMGFVINLVAASSDGNLGLDKIKERVGDSFEGGEKVMEAIEEALEDVSISVMEGRMSITLPLR